MQQGPQGRPLQDGAANIQQQAQNAPSGISNSNTATRHQSQGLAAESARNHRPPPASKDRQPREAQKAVAMLRWQQQAPSMSDSMKKLGRHPNSCASQQHRSNYQQQHQQHTQCEARRPGKSVATWRKRCRAQAAHGENGAFVKAARGESSVLAKAAPLRH